MTNDHYHGSVETNKLETRLWIRMINSLGNCNCKIHTMFFCLSYPHINSHNILFSAAFPQEKIGEAEHQELEVSAETGMCNASKCMTWVGKLTQYECEDLIHCISKTATVRIIVYVL